MSKNINCGLAFLMACFVAAGSEAVPKARLIASAEPDWPQFRGIRRDGICDEHGLLRAWPESGPRLLWTATNLGRGFSSPTIVGNRLHLTGDLGEELHIFSLDLEGGVKWRATNGASWREQYPGARASVTCSAGRLYHENAHGRVACLEAGTGRELWSMNVLERFGGRNITWGLSECLLVDDRNVYVTVGGSEALMVALDKSTGKVRWKSPPLIHPAGERGVESAGYASPILVEFAGRRLLIGCSLRHLVCVDADSGKQQWTRPFPTAYSVLALTPALVGNAVFATAPHGNGGRLFQLVPPSGASEPVGATEVWSTRLDSLQGGVVSMDGRIYGSYYTPRKGWAALDAKSGETLWEEAGFTKGAVLAAGARLYAFSEDGWMRLLEPGQQSFLVRGQFRLVEAKDRDAWAHPVIHRGRLYLRYHETLFCYDISEKKEK